MEKSHLGFPVPIRISSSAPQYLPTKRKKRPSNVYCPMFPSPCHASLNPTMRAKSAKIATEAEQANEYIAIPCLLHARRTGGKAESMCPSECLYRYVSKQRLKIYLVWTRREEKQASAERCMSRHAVPSSLALQQKPRMLARIKYYKCFGVDKSPADIQNRGWPRDQFMYFKGAGTELIIGGRLRVEMPARFANDVRNAWSSGHKRENSRYRDRDNRGIAQ